MHFFDFVELFVTLVHVLYMSYEKCVMVGLLVLKGLLNKAYCDSLKYICKTIENVNNIADNSLQEAF